MESSIGQRTPGGTSPDSLGDTGGDGDSSSAGDGDMTGVGDAAGAGDGDGDVESSSLGVSRNQSNPSSMKRDKLQILGICQ